jgi:hypothetical protein
MAVPCGSEWHLGGDASFYAEGEARLRPARGRYCQPFAGQMPYGV